ncbi:MAG: inner membrane protein [Thermotogota bacterium]|nr:inner membrane protein [Thermotogota bacterium]MDK2865475.1 inner membrane protein [Thermotogota bacterium]
MPNLKTHLTLGVFTYPVFLSSYTLIASKFQPAFDPTLGVITAGYLAYIVGSDLPDIDHKDAPVQHQLKALSIPPLALVFQIWLAKYFEQSLSASIGQRVARIAIFTVSLFISYLLVSTLLRFLKHRGFTHSITFAAMYGGLLYMLFRLVRLPPENAMYIAISGFTGDLIHLIADNSRSFSKIFKLW